jgi:hypothetical protein
VRTCGGSAVCCSPRRFAGSSPFGGREAAAPWRYARAPFARPGKGELRSPKRGITSERASSPEAPACYERKWWRGQRRWRLLSFMGVDCDDAKTLFWEADGHTRLAARRSVSRSRHPSAAGRPPLLGAASGRLFQAITPLRHGLGVYSLPQRTFTQVRWSSRFSVCLGAARKRHFLQASLPWRDGEVRVQCYIPRAAPGTSRSQRGGGVELGICRRFAVRHTSGPPGSWTLPFRGLVTLRPPGPATALNYRGRRA